MTQNQTIITQDFIATNCNSSYEALDWVDQTIAIFGGCNIIYIYNVESVKNEFSTNLHRGTVNTVTCLYIGDKIYVLSGSFEGEVILWSYETTINPDTNT